MCNTTERMVIPFSFSFSNFIDEECRQSIEIWARSVFKELKPNIASDNRFYNKLSSLSSVHNSLYQIKEEIGKTIDKEFIYDPFFEDFLSFNLNGGAIHHHTDPNSDGYIHTRYNLIISAPNAGGNPIYNGEEFQIHERMLWCCRAGEIVHGSTPVIGNKPRINISFGFQIKP